MKPIDIIFISIALLVLLFSYYKKNEINEHFAPIQTDKIKIEEDISDINKTCVMYNTAFSSDSYGLSSDKIWKSIINPDKERQVTFDSTPVFSNINGFYLGNNIILGPDANDLGIDFLSTYTILIAVKHGNLLTDNSLNDIEFIKLYAINPTNNNGLALYIKANTLDSHNNVLVGELQLQYSDLEPKKCLISPSDDKINFEKDMMTYYFIIKDTDNFRIQMMTEKSNTISQILKFTVNNQLTNFANSKLLINRFNNLNASIFNLSVFNKALSDDDVTKTYNHIQNEYMKRIDQNFTSVIEKYNENVDVMEELTKCPFNDNVCKKCQSVDKWYDVNDIVNSSDICKKSINDFCTINQKHYWCKCWDSSGPLYNSANYQLFRSIFNGKETIFDSLSDIDLASIKAKYNLITTQDCTNLTKAQELTWRDINKINEPQKDKITIKLHDKDIISNRKKTGKNIINYYSETDPSLDPQIESTSSIQNDYNIYQDIEKKIDPTQTIAFKETNSEDSYFNKFLKIIMPN